MDEQMKAGETGDKNVVIDQKLRQFFDGKIVRKDLTKKIKEGANVPVYVLEFLLGQYCSSDDPEVIENGVENVKRILADNYVRPDEAQKILSCVYRMAQASGGGRYGSVMLVNVLRGSKREEVRRLGFDKISTWGLLKEHSAQNVHEMINFLISENYLQMENSDYPVLSFTERTMPFLRSATPLIMRRTEERAQKAERLKKRAKSVEIVRSELFEELRALRRAIATEEGVPPYVVFTDKTLSAICDMLPTDEEEFLEVPGVGAAKLERYGEAFIDAVNDWKSRQG